MAVTPSPTPTVGAGTQSILGAVAGQGAQSSPNPADPFAGLAAIAGGGTTSKTSTETLLGVGTTGTQKVDTSGLGSLSSATTITDAVNAFDKLWQTDDTTFQYLQQQLNAAGFYGASGFTGQYGVYSSADQAAFVNAVKAASQSGSNLQQYLTTRASIGLTNGVKALPSDVTVIAHPSQVDTDTALENEAKSLTGTNVVSAALLARFHAVYDSAYVAGQRQAVKEQAAAAANANSQVASGVTDALNRQSSGADSQTPQGWVTNPFGQILASGQAAQDTSTLNNAAAGTLTPQGGLTADITQAPTVAAAADQFLQQNDAPAIGANNVANKYGTLLGILAGKGS